MGANSTRSIHWSEANMWSLNEVTNIEYRSGHSFLISFDDGVSGVVDFSEYLNRGPVFAPLRDLDFSARLVSKEARSPGQMVQTLRLRPCIRNVGWLRPECCQFEKCVSAEP